MKKSKIIIPALGILLLSTAASVTGTVAWFTATRSVTTTAGEFQIAKTDGNLKATLAAGIGTNVSGSAAAVNSNVIIGDRSINPNTLQLWNDLGDGASFETVGDTTSWSKADSASEWKISSTLYHAVSWKISLQYEFGADTTDQDIFFDMTSVATVTAGSTTGAGSDTVHETSTSFRLAFVIDNGTSAKLVWAPLQTGANLSYVSAADATTTYASGFANKYIASDTAALSPAKAANAASGHTSRLDYLGTVSSADDTIDVTCIVWFEGTDPNVRDDEGHFARMDKINATLKFYCATAAA